MGTIIDKNHLSNDSSHEIALSPRKYDMSKRAAAVEATRGRMVEATLELHQEQGILATSWEDIAKRAGTGNATLYRRFPTRGDLVAAVFADRMAEHLDAVEAGLADDDPWRGFASYVETVAAMQARDRGIADLVTMDVSSAPEIEELRSRAYDGLVRLVARAHQAGVLREDFTDQDVVLLLMANAGLVERAHGIPAEASARLRRKAWTARWRSHATVTPAQANIDRSAATKTGSAAASTARSTIRNMRSGIGPDAFRACVVKESPGEATGAAASECSPAGR